MLLAIRNGVTYGALALGVMLAPSPWSWLILGAMVGMAVTDRLKLEEQRDATIRAAEIGYEQLDARKAAAAFAITISDVALETAQELAEHDLDAGKARIQQVRDRIAVLSEHRQ